ncbi:hypothetical protein B296_00023319 [Ensete ventricosum]|uniref:Uncharacterized protein n=1 Tax=Ensete ventricosum TaxID=4639 RepID=A0A427AJT7_ENSVE|nr:hypothetical protein B296_00023319 [Ensete ventricosum]
MGCSSTKLRSSAAADLHALELKKVIQRNPELAAFAKEYPEFILPAIKSGLDDLDRCLDKALFGVGIIHAAIEHYEEEETTKQQQHRRNKKKKKADTKEKHAYAKTVAKLKELKRAGHPFAGLNAKEPQQALSKLRTTMDRLRDRKKEIKAALRSTKRWRNLWDVVFTAAFIGVLVCSVVLAATGAAPVAITAGTAGATAIKAMEPWANSLWDERETALRDEKEVVKMMLDEGLSVHEHDNIRSLVVKLWTDVETIMKKVEFVLQQEDEEAMQVGMTELKKKMEAVDVKGSINSLKDKVDACKQEIQPSESKFLKITRD